MGSPAPPPTGLKGSCAWEKRLGTRPGRVRFFGIYRAPRVRSASVSLEYTVRPRVRSASSPRPLSFFPLCRGFEEMFNFI
eukprot:gene13591-biopygen20046